MGGFTTERVVKVKLDDGAYLPERFHATDAGADLRTPFAFTLPAHKAAIVDTGVHVQLPAGTKGEIKSKSGLNIKHDIIAAGLIDEGFTGSITVKLYNLGDNDYHFEAGDKITQLVISNVRYEEFVDVDEIDGGERGNAGYGSTGR